MHLNMTDYEKLGCPVSIAPILEFGANKPKKKYLIKTIKTPYKYLIKINQKLEISKLDKISNQNEER